MREQLVMRQQLEQVLQTLGDRSPIQEIRPVAGGDINRVYCVQTAGRKYCVKWNEKLPPGFFAKEAEGLERIRQSGAIAVPHVYAVQEDLPERAGLLVLEWVEGAKTAATDEQLGRGVAALHQTAGPAFGWESDTYIGTLPQPNRWYRQWSDYYRECRLLPQLELGKRLGRMSGQRGRRLEKVIGQLEQWLPKQALPSLLHGDLWSGNWLVGPAGRPYLIDPSVCYGHDEFELAFTELFGGFSERFYRSYREVRPVSAEYAERKPLYQLFYLLVHLNLFGEAYGPAVDRILQRYAG
nr:fructosamine kinase family protein [Brevibacillus marinus]